MDIQLWILGILDSHHDFAYYFSEKGKHNNNFIAFKKYYCSIIKYNDSNELMKIYYDYFTHSSDNVSADYKISQNLDGIFINESITFEQKVFNNFININFDLVNIKSILQLNEVKLIIISNFKQLFTTNLNDEQIVELRIPLYWLVFYCKNDKKNESIIKLIAWFKEKLNQQTLNQKIITKKCANIKKNITYPIVYTSDMNIDKDYLSQYHINEYPYQLVNYFKKHIDGANTLSDNNKILKTINIPNLYQNSDLVGKLMLTIPEQTDDLVINFAGVKYYFLLDEKQFVCEFGEIYLKVSSNSVSSIRKYFKSFYSYICDENINITTLIKINTCGLNKIKQHENPTGLLMYLLFGFKRYGDWIQSKICKNNYISIQTRDALLQTYMILIGSPIIVNGYVYNYEPAIDLNMNSFAKLQKTNKLLVDIADDDKLELYGSMVDPSRLYFYKYIKYKLKYMKLKKLINK